MQDCENISNNGPNENTNPQCDKTRRVVLWTSAVAIALLAACIVYVHSLPEQYFRYAYCLASTKEEDHKNCWLMNIGLPEKDEYMRQHENTLPRNLDY